MIALIFIGFILNYLNILRGGILVIYIIGVVIQALIDLVRLGSMIIMEDE